MGWDSSTFAGGPLGNFEYDSIKRLAATLALLPIRRRHLAKQVEARCGIPLRRQTFSRRLCDDDAFALLSSGDLAGLAAHLEVGIAAGYGKNRDLVAESAREVFVETCDRQLRLGFVTQAALDDLTVKLADRQDLDGEVLRLVDLGLGRHDTRPLTADEHAWQLRARPELLDRDVDLDNLDEMTWSTGGYVVITGGAWSGKTSLVCELALTPHVGVTVVSFFVRATRGRTQAADFLASVVEQLSRLTNQPPARGDDFAARRRNYEELWREACDLLERDQKRLVLLVDGLDEQDHTATVTISELLPDHLASNAVVIVATRPNPPNFRGPDSLNRARLRPYELTKSPYAEAREHEANQVIRKLTSTPGSLEAVCFGQLATATGPLSTDELAMIVDRADWEVEQAITTFHNQTNGDGTAMFPWEVAHETLKNPANKFTAGWWKDRTASYDRWAEPWRERRWPTDTPVHLVSHYYKSRGPDDRTRRLELASDLAYLEAMSRQAGGRAQALTLTEEILTPFITEPVPAAIAVVALTRAEILRRTFATPAGTVALLARLGRWPHVYGLITEAPTDQLRTKRITEAAPHLTPHNSITLTSLAQQITHDGFKSRALVAVATALAQHDLKMSWSLITQLALDPGLQHVTERVATLIRLGDDSVITIFVTEGHQQPAYW